MELEKNTRKSIYMSFLDFACTTIFLLAGHTSCFASTVVLLWNPNTDPGLAGYKVYYQADSSTQPFQGTGAMQGAAPIDIHNQTTASISGLDPAHAYYFAVSAYNSSGVESPYSNIVFVPELVSPTVSLTLPANNATVSGTVSISASATDNVEVSHVEYYVNGTLQATDSSTPYVFVWDTSALVAGTYSLTAKAYDFAGNVGQSNAVSVNVVYDTTAPTVTVTSPASNNTVTGTTSITASASDNVGVSRVEFFGNGVLLSATNVSPYSSSWNTKTAANGRYTLTAKAYDGSGNVSQSPGVTVNVSNVAILGDLDADNNVTIADALLALKVAVDLVPSSTYLLAVGDVAPDGKIDIQDALMLLRVVVGSIALEKF